MMKSPRHILLTTAILGALGAGIASAQINKEVEIRYEESPQLTDIQKLTLTPAIQLPALKSAALPYSTTNPTIAMPGNITTLDPAGYADTIYASPYRGYAALGFMPRFNLGASAGYKILNTDHTRLNAFLQYDGTSYKPKDSEESIRSNTATIGASLHQAVGKKSFVDAGIDYTFSHYNQYLWQRTDVDDPNTNQSTNRLNASALWSMVSNHAVYGVGVAYSYFNYARGLAAHPHENEIKAQAFVAYHINDKSRFHANVTADYLTAPLVLLTSDGTDADAYSTTLLRLKPAYEFTYKNLHFDIGLEADLAFGDNSGFHIAPDVQATWTPGHFFKLFVKASGGDHLNTLASLYEVSRFSPALHAERKSYVPVEADFGITLGTWRGLYGQIKATYARANDWLMPMTDASDRMSYMSVDMQGLKLAFEADYNFRNVVEVKASYEIATKDDFDRGYYLWRDRARRVASAALTIRPIPALDINVGWQYRGGRSIVLSHQPDGRLSQSLGSVSNLNAGAIYRITPRWSAFLRGENLLGRQTLTVGLIPDQGRTGLLGLTYKF